mmetsp:Transcript_13755/g.33870  ORF Transcript_13755/g.33870 Transcript_13755/m.33870 type:complete len:119 (-) Transcript_13755:731-1087(-)
MFVSYHQGEYCVPVSQGYTIAKFTARTSAAASAVEESLSALRAGPGPSAALPLRLPRNDITFPFPTPRSAPMPAPATPASDPSALTDVDMRSTRTTQASSIPAEGLSQAFAAVAADVL